MGALFFLSAMASAFVGDKQLLAVPLQSVETGLFTDFPSKEPLGLKPAFKENRFPLPEAVNWLEVNKLVGPLSEEQIKFLDEKRFILLPKPQFMLARPDAGFAADEMLGNFDGLGGRQAEKDRRPENARFIGPDVVLHAFHRYTATRLEALEAGPLRQTAGYMLKELLESAEQLKKASLKSQRDWEMLMAQLVVPLVILENCSAAEADEGAVVDILDRALDHIELYRP